MLLGLIAGYFGGIVDSIIMRIMDGMLSFPYILLAMVLMRLLLPGLGRCFSMPGISVAGAAAHNIGQIVAAVIVLGTWDVAGYLPFLLVLALPTGLVTGMVSAVVLGHLDKLHL